VNALNENRLIKIFTELEAANAKTLIPFITAGHPDMATTEGLLKDFEARGARICELGIPFSDPIADGPTIQNSYTDALTAGTTSKKIFKLTSRYRADGGKLALVAMVSYSIVYRHGVERYLADLYEAGFDGLIIPDLSLEEAPALEGLAAAKGLTNVMLIAPTTPPQRRLEIARHSRGFIYFISIAGITGERDKLPEGTIAAVGELRKHTDTPVCVGFGISNPQMVVEVCKVADGAIVGSALVRRISDLKDAPIDQRVKELGEFVTTLIRPLNQ